MCYPPATEGLSPRPDPGPGGSRERSRTSADRAGQGAFVLRSLDEATARAIGSQVLVLEVPAAVPRRCSGFDSSSRWAEGRCATRDPSRRPSVGLWRRCHAGDCQFESPRGCRGAAPGRSEKLAPLFFAFFLLSFRAASPQMMSLAQRLPQSLRARRGPRIDPLSPSLLVADRMARNLLCFGHAH
jgi:hypothetical protein